MEENQETKTQEAKNLTDEIFNLRKRNKMFLTIMVAEGVALILIGITIIVTWI
jgi:hypothetical protein